eukprot:COSAG06_NODE_5872_length_3234_cov_3.348006_5_plen_167_part_00
MWQGKLALDLDGFEEAVVEAARESENSIVQCVPHSHSHIHICHSCICPLDLQCSFGCVWFFFSFLPCWLLSICTCVRAVSAHRYDKNGHSAHVMLGKGWHLEEQCVVVASSDVSHQMPYPSATREWSEVDTGKTQLFFTCGRFFKLLVCVHIVSQRAMATWRWTSL